MKIKKHIDVIKNFADISPAIIFTSGSIKIAKRNGSVYALYEWEEKLPVGEFGIYNVREFAQILSLFDDPDVEVVELENASSEAVYQIVIKGKNSASKYLTTSPAIIKQDSEDEIKSMNKFTRENLEKLGKADVTFTMDKSLLKKIKNAISVTEAGHVIFTTEDGKLKITFTDKDNPSANVFSIFIDENFEGEISAPTSMYSDDFVMIEGSYTIDIFSDKMVIFKEDEKKIIYVVSVTA